MGIDEPCTWLHAHAGEPRSAGAVVAEEAAAHAWLIAATDTRPGVPPRYVALPVRRVAVMAPVGAALPQGATRATGPVADAILGAIELYAEPLALPDGPTLEVLSREAVLAQLLARGGLAIGLAGLLLRVTKDRPIDPDVVREVLKSARLGERFQPLHELLAIA